MVETIGDGSGKGNVAKVDDDLRLSAQANIQTEEHFISSRDANTFFANTADTANTLTTTATGGPILYIKNGNPDKQMIVAKVLASTDIDGGVMRFIRNPTLGTIGNNNTHTPQNLNFNSNKSAQGTFYNWNENGDGMTGLSGGTVLKTFIISKGFNVFPLDAALVLENDDSFAIEFIGAGEFECGVRFFYMVAEE